jgi:hypothetical protein
MEGMRVKQKNKKSRYLQAIERYLERPDPVGVREHMCKVSQHSIALK